MVRTEERRQLQAVLEEGDDLLPLLQLGFCGEEVPQLFDLLAALHGIELDFLELFRH